MRPQRSLSKVRYERFVLAAMLFVAIFGRCSHAYAADVPLGGISNGITPFSVPYPIQFSALNWSAGYDNGNRWAGYFVFYTDAGGTNVIATSQPIGLPAYGCNGDCGTLSFPSVISFAPNTTYYGQFVETTGDASFVIGLHPSGIGYAGNDPPYNTNSVFYDTSDVETGAIQVTTNLSNAPFTITGPETLSGVGTMTFPNVPPGMYTITFGTVSSYSPPILQPQTVAAGGTLTFVGNYATLVSYSFSTNRQGRGITVGPDNAIWFATPTGVGRIDVGGNETFYPGPGGFGITSGPDGALWLADSVGDSIIRMSLTGVVTNTYPVPTQGSQPLDITLGSDGALWFTEYAAGKIGRITTSGSITEFPTVTPASKPAHLTKGPDGAVWFAESGARQIGRIATSGQVTEYLVPTEPFGITTGPDGNIWFTQYNAIGRRTSSGTINRFPVTSGSQPEGIAGGPDGNIWFTEATGNRIGSLAVLSVAPHIVNEYSLPTLNSQPYAITSGPDGTLWFTEIGTSDIGQLIPANRRNAIDISWTAGFPSSWPPTFLAQLQDSGIALVAVEAPQQPYCSDPQCAMIAQQQLDALSGAGFATAAYCFLHFKNAGTGAAQAQNCLNTIQSSRISSLFFIALDVEGKSTVSQTDATTIIMDAANVVTNAPGYGKPPVIYTSQNAWNTITGSSTAFASDPLWITGGGFYDAAGNPHCGDGSPNLSWSPPHFGGWAGASVRQYDLGVYVSGTGCVSPTLFGVTADFDVFTIFPINGSAQESDRVTIFTRPF